MEENQIRSNDLESFKLFIVYLALAFSVGFSVSQLIDLIAYKTNALVFALFIIISFALVFVHDSIVKDDSSITIKVSKFKLFSNFK